MAGPAGFEPATPGFGVRCSTNSSYGPASTRYSTLLGFLVQGVFVTPLAVLLFLHLLSLLFLVDEGNVVPPLAFGTGQPNDVCHAFLDS